MKPSIRFMTEDKTRITAEFLILLPAKDTTNTTPCGKAANKCISFAGIAEPEMDVMTKTIGYRKKKSHNG